MYFSFGSVFVSIQTQRDNGSYISSMNGFLAAGRSRVKKLRTMERKIASFFSCKIVEKGDIMATQDGSGIYGGSVSI